MLRANRIAAMAVKGPKGLKVPVGDARGQHENSNDNQDRKRGIDKASTSVGTEGSGKTKLKIALQ